MAGQASTAVREGIEKRMRAGETLYIVRKDDWILPIVLEMQGEGLVTCEIVSLGSQSSMRVRATERLLQGV